MFVSRLIRVGFGRRASSAGDFAIFDHDVTLHFLVNDVLMVFFFGLATKEASARQYIARAVRTAALLALLAIARAPRTS